MAPFFLFDLGHSSRVVVHELLGRATDGGGVAGGIVSAGGGAHLNKRDHKQKGPNKRDQSKYWFETDTYSGPFCCLLLAASLLLRKYNLVFLGVRIECIDHLKVLNSANFSYLYGKSETTESGSETHALSAS